MKISKKSILKGTSRGTRKKSKAGFNKVKIDLAKSVKDIINNDKFKLYLKLALIALAFIVIIIFAIIFISKFVYANKYKIYEDKMATYSYDKLYNNGKNKASEKVTKAEAIKLAIITVLNEKDITWFAKEYSEYDGQTFVEYAKSMNIIAENDITAENYNCYVTYEEAVMYFEKAKTALSDKEVKSADYEVLRRPETYGVEVQTAFSDMVANKIIKIKTKNINAHKKAIKGEINELVVNFLEEYAFISLDGARLRFTDLPKNADKYPYILFDVPNEIYEYDFAKGDPLVPEMEAKELYLYQNEYYSQIRDFVKGYYEALLNVDYTNLNLVSYTDKMDRYIVFSSLTSSVADYYKYVLDNHIKMSANVTMIEPCIYFDGSSYRVRIKIDLNILSTDTRNNLVLYDALYGDTYTYNQNSYTIYADAKLTNAINSDNIYIQPQVQLMNITLNSSDLDITYTPSVNEKEAE